MKEKQNIIFDLDGTLIDSQEGIVHSVRHALTAMGIKDEEQIELTRFIGPPLLDSFMKYYDMSKEDAEKAIALYREDFHEHGLHKNSLYPEIDCLIKDLATSGKNLALATTKPQVYAVEILESYDLRQYFSFIAGSNLDGSLTNKSELIALAMKKSNMTSPEKTVMVGDTRFDMLGANHHSIDSIGVLYGFGSKEELEEYHPTIIVKTPQELRGVLL